MRDYVPTVKASRLIPHFKLARKVYNEFGVLRIELGRYWEINITREMQEQMWDGSRQPPDLHRDKGFIRKLKQGEILPKWYGYAYRNFDCDYAVYMPIPLNLIRAFWEWFRFNVIYKFKSTWPRSMDNKHWLLSGTRQVLEEELRTLYGESQHKENLKLAIETLDRIRGLA
jgi:hypothetical protein